MEAEVARTPIECWQEEEGIVGFTYDMSQERCGTDRLPFNTDERREGPSSNSIGDGGSGSSNDATLLQKLNLPRATVRIKRIPKKAGVLANVSATPRKVSLRDEANALAGRRQSIEILKQMCSCLAAMTQHKIIQICANQHDEAEKIVRKEELREQQKKRTKRLKLTRKPPADTNFAAGRSRSPFHSIIRSLDGSHHQADFDLNPFEQRHNITPPRSHHIDSQPKVLIDRDAAVFDMDVGSSRGMVRASSAHKSPIVVDHEICEEVAFKIQPGQSIGDAVEEVRAESEPVAQSSPPPPPRRSTSKRHHQAPAQPVPVCLFPGNIPPKREVLRLQQGEAESILKRKEAVTSPPRPLPPQRTEVINGEMGAGKISVPILSDTCVYGRSLSAFSKEEYKRLHTSGYDDDTETTVSVVDHNKRRVDRNLLSLLKSISFRSHSFC
uniref:Uncharacterized protein n=1 Tax=Palpitomonas bilix TaxID=652834 RepID=A0A7S3FYE2_9EUKA